jgi:hypothetical protein
MKIQIRFQDEKSAFRGFRTCSGREYAILYKNKEGGDRTTAMCRMPVEKKR